MFKTRVQKQNEYIDDLINAELDKLVNTNLRDDQVKAIEAKVLILKEMKEEDNGIDANTVALVAGNLLGILLILNHERMHVISSKALGFVMKGRV